MNKRFAFILFTVLVFILVRTCCFAADVTLQWDANTEPDLAGYKIYHGTESGVYGEPIDAGNVTEYTVTGLEERQYFFVVTAHDTEGLESDYSNEVFTTDMQKPSAPVITFTVKITVETQGQ